jgi:hypothetical protein
MRLSSILPLLTLLLAAQPAAAEKNVFIVASDADGYGVDRCLSTGASCGAAVAAAYCQSRAFQKAASYRKLDRENIASDADNPLIQTCRGNSCTEFVAIECAR